jgi:hypothetical protein
LNIVSHVDMIILLILTQQAEAQIWWQSKAY